jgi:penicillin-binding protein 2
VRVIGEREVLYIQRPTSSYGETFRRRLRVLITAIFIGFFLLLARTWHLQVIQGEYFLRLSENNRLRSLRTKSLRGKILDRHGHVLADNRPAFTLMAIPEDLPPLEQLPTLLQTLNLEVAPEVFKSHHSAVAFKPLPIKRDVPRDRVAYFAEHRMDFPGLYLEIEPLRSYPYGTLAAHLLGYLGEIGESQLQRNKHQDYQLGDLIGQYGLERTYESTLRGHHGVRQVEVDALGREVQLIAAQDPKPGMNLVLTLDLQLQQLAEQLLEEHTGAIVALDPRNGQILALASSPAFDPNTFAVYLSKTEWAALNHNPKRPLNNRALQGQYPPGSIFKIVTALAALEENVITPQKTQFCPGSYAYGGRIFRDWKSGGHGTMSLRQAIIESCDVYFYHVGQELGVDRIARYARAFGLGQTMGLAPEGEKSGLIPSTQWKRRVRDLPWYAGETLSVAIGQGYVLFTPLQAANMIATVANGGTVYKPYVVLRQERADGTVLRETAPEILHQLQVKPQHLAAVRQGLLGVVNDPKGTGKKAAHEHIAIAGKTGTAQVVGLAQHSGPRQRQEQIPERYRDHAWFVAFAPFEAPTIAVVVMVEHAGKGGSQFAEYAKTLIQAHVQRYPIATAPQSQGISRP